MDFVRSRNKVSVSSMTGLVLSDKFLLITRKEGPFFFSYGKSPGSRCMVGGVS